MESVQDFLSDNFKKRSMGLVCDFAREINKVYTAVFPSSKIMKEILAKNETDIMLFVHHPSIWDIRKAPEAFQQMDKKLLKKFRERRISIYNLHVPLDNFGEYSTGASLAKTLGFKVEKPFARYYGGKDGVICLTNLKNVQEVKKKLEAVLGHKASLYKYGTNKIKDGKIAIITGGGNNVEHLKEVASEAVNTFITGITVINEYSKKAHDYAQKHRINIFGGTHYSTEKFACIAICEYFKKIGLPSKFIEDKPVLRDT
jgi:putative NIF3 family GTP cyclohydrolase 1 type 2